MKKVIFILSFLALIFWTLSLRGVYPRSNLTLVGLATAAEPLRNDINKFGIHILEPSDLPKAQELVNSSSGDWGWVTVVIRDDDMNHDKWQNFMDDCRVRHLVPLVRIATHLEGENWAKPKKDDAQNWTNFLNDLNWPVADRYVIIFNEPNHTKEWGGEVNPKEYAKILLEFINKFKIYNLKFKILNAGLDLAAPNSKTTMDSGDFMKQMNEEIPGIFEKLDGWVSHSYPNHGYLGKPWDSGKHSVRGYEWELATLKNDFGLKKELPVFITETGWPKLRSEKSEVRSVKRYYDKKTVAEYIKYAFQNVWLKDERIKAVTPFVLNYPGELFYDFSWLDKDGKPFRQFEEIKLIKKNSLWPEQEEKFTEVFINIPSFMPENTKYTGKIKLKNNGQSILGERKIFVLKSESVNEIKVSGLTAGENFRVNPGETFELNFTIESASFSGEFVFGWEKLKQHKIRVVPSGPLTQIRYGFFERILLDLKRLMEIN